MIDSILHIIYIRLNYNDSNKLKIRLKLFEKYCLPSLISQTNKNFKIYININFEHYNLIYDYVKLIDNIILTNKDIEFISNCKRTEKYLITTRIDSDDIINVNLIDSIQKFISNKYIQRNMDLLNKSIILNYSMGLQLDTNNVNHNIYKRIYYIPNPFLSIITKKNFHCKKYDHHIFHNDRNNFIFINLKNKIPMWIQVIHNENITNKINFNNPNINISNASLKELFNISL